ncbi:MAG: type II secretion system F family protein [Deltaproteobacteria bacterium]|nr:type II secretion system F family protein [Deltaproteobacteria bacterium]
MTWLPWIVVLAGVAALVGVAVGVHALFRESRRALVLDRRLQAVRARARSTLGETARRSGDAADTLSYLSLVFSSVLRVAAMLVPVGASERAKLGALVAQAGFQQRDALAVFLSLKMLLALVAGVFAGFLASGVEKYGEYLVFVVFAGLAGAVFGGVLPEMALRRLSGRRLNRMSRALPDALDLMVLCVAAGYTFERALAMVAQELKPLAPELAAELASVESELRVGADRRQVLQDLYTRTEAEGLRDFAMTVIQGERYGTPMGQSLQNIAQNERTQRAARIEAQAGRLPVIMSLPMLLLVVPGILLLMGGPAFMMAVQAIQGLGGN